MPKLPRKPNDIPRDPDSRYRRSWINWNDWLSSDKMRVYGVDNQRSFEEAREFVRSLHLNGQIEWKKYCKGELKGYDPKPNNIPATPYNTYKNTGWIDFGDWLGTGRKRRGNNTNKGDTWLPYKEARDFVHKLNLKSYDEWRKYINGELNHLPRKPDNIPNSAYFVYKDNGWTGMSDWLGYESINKTKVKEALSFEEARTFVRSLGLRDENEWNNYKKGEYEHLEPLPSNIPKLPRKYYRDNGWIGIRDWLGVE